MGKITVPPYPALKLCSNNCLFENQVRKLKSFMSWNGFQRTIRSLLISKLKSKPSNARQTRNNISDENDARPKIWLPIPYLGRQGESLVRKCLKKLQRNLNVSVNFIAIYNTKKLSYFLSNKDKIPKLSKSKVVYEVTCPGCCETYIGQTERCVQKRLSEHNKPDKSALGNTLTTAEYVQHIISLHHACDDNITLTDTSTFIYNLICDNVKILHNANSNTSNFLLFLEALYIKFLSPSLNSGLKASKELTLFS